MSKNFNQLRDKMSKDQKQLSKLSSLALALNDIEMHHVCGPETGWSELARVKWEDELDNLVNSFQNIAKDIAEETLMDMKYGDLDD